MTSNRKSHCILLLTLFFLFLLVVDCTKPSYAQQQTAQSTSTHTVVVLGKVSDAKTGEGIAKAIVSIRQQSLHTVTDSSGAFRLSGVSPGEIEIYVSTVGYELLKTKLQVFGDRDVEADIYLGQQASKPKETITVVADPLDGIQPSVVSSSNTLDNTELKNLATVVVDDPLRSVQTLPGVTTSDDYNAQFSLRGFGFSGVGVYLDGVLVSSPFHTAEDIQQNGSITIFNGDVVDSLELISGGFPARYGDRQGAILDIRTREGSQERIFTRADIGMAGVSATTEGPIGSAHHVSWLVSARKSYIGTLLREWGADYMAVGYSDLQSKLSFRPSSAHQFTLGGMLGSGWFEPAVDSTRFSHIKKGQTTTAIVDIGWNWAINHSALLHTQAAYVQLKAWNHDQQDQRPFESRAHDVSAQQELGVQLLVRHFVTAGWSVRRGNENLFSNYYDLQFTDFLVSAKYDRSAWYSSAYLQDSWQIIPGWLQLNFGGRTEHFTSTGQNLWMPRASLSLRVTHNDKFTFSWGQYGQFPSFRQLFGEVYNNDLRAERATHYIVGIEHRLNDKTRIRVEGYEIRLREASTRPIRNGVLHAHWT